MLCLLSISSSRLTHCHDHCHFHPLFFSRSSENFLGSLVPTCLENSTEASEIYVPFPSRFSFTTQQVKAVLPYPTCGIEPDLRSISFTAYLYTSVSESVVVQTMKHYSSTSFTGYELAAPYTYSRSSPSSPHTHIHPHLYYTSTPNLFIVNNPPSSCPLLEPWTTSAPTASRGYYRSARLPAPWPFSTAHGMEIHLKT